MSKVTVALVSFVAGVSSVLLFSMFFGNHISMAAQLQYVIEGAVPVVPPLHGNVFSGEINGGIQPLDGLECGGCSFKDVAFTYGGGAVRLADPKFSGNIRISFTGAAANTLATVAFLQAMLQNNRPPAFNPNAPIIKRASAKEIFTADLTTPYGQKE